MILPAFSLLFSAIALPALAQLTVNPVGFENNAIGGWTPQGSSESVVINSTAAYTRTGSYSLQLATTATSSNKYWYSNTPFGASASGTYVHFICWALATDAVTTIDASMRYAGTNPPTGTGSTANGTSTAINTASWTRLTHSAGNSNNRYYFPAPRRNSGNATSFYLDDVLVYTSGASTPDLTDPATPAALTGTPSGSTVNLGWTSNTDAGTGVQETIVLRTANTAAAPPDLNDQAVYSTAGGASGPNTVGSWTVIAVATATATSYADVSVPAGNYQYAVVLRDLAYNYSVAAVSPVVTVGVAGPAITLGQAGFSGSFGNVATGTNSAAQQYTVSGSALTGNISVTAPAGFGVSLTSGTGFASSLNLVPAGGTVAPTTIYVHYSPTAATGATGNLQITHTSTGAASQQATVNGNALAAEPTTAGTLSFGTVGATSIVVNLPAAGNGTKRIIVGRPGNAVNYTPADGTTVSGGNSNFSAATDQGNGNKVVYDGTGSGNNVVTVTGLIQGTAYFFTVYEYNEGTGTSRNYLTAPAASGSVTTIIPTPAIALNQTGFTGTFGNVVSGSNSAEQQYTVSAVNLTAALTLTAPAGFALSLTSGTGFTSSVTLTPASGTVAATTIYARYSPASATGATGSQSITHASTGAVTQQVAVSGNALATEPTTAGTIAFGTTTSNSVVVDLPASGNGGKRIIVIKQGIAPTFTPADGSAISGVNAGFTSATDQGGANKVVYDGMGSGSGVVTVSGLTPGTAYYFTVFEYNEGTGTSQNYLLTPAASGSVTTPGLPSPSVTLNTTGFNGSFGNVVTGTSSIPQSYTVSGANLTGNMIITAPADFEVSLSSASGYAPTLSLTPSGGAVAATTVYVRYAPLAATGASGSQTIAHASPSAAVQNTTVSGNALATEPATAGTLSFGTITSNAIVVNLPAAGNGSKRIIVARAGAAVTFSPADGTTAAGVNALFTAATDQGNGNRVVYDGAGSGTGVVTVSGLTQGTTYYFTVFEYNEGTGTSRNYLVSPAATANATTNVPSIALNQTGFTGIFGNVVSGTASTVQQYAVSGANLTGNITITAPAGFEVSLAAASGFAASATLTPSGAAVPVTTIYARYAPTAATGATGSQTITHSSPGTGTQNATVSGNALATEPTTAGTLTFGTVTGTSILINLPATGNGSRRTIVARQGTAVSYTPADGTAATGVNANFSTATDQGGGNKIVYNGTGSGNGVVTVSGLTMGTTYHFTVYEYHEGTGTSQNYLISPAAANSTSTAVPAISLTSSGFNGTFGNVVTGTTSPVQSFTVSGTNLVANISLTAPSGFQLSTSATSGFASSLNLVQSGGTVANIIVYARYAPTAASGGTGNQNITLSSNSATAQTLTVSGNALAAEPTTAATITFSNVTATSIGVNLPAAGNSARRIIVIRAGSAVTFTPSDGVAVTGVNPSFATATDQGGGNRVIYDGTASGNNVVHVTGLTQGTTYHFTVYGYNEGTGSSQNYLVNPAATGTATTIIPPATVILGTTGFNGNFGNTVAGTLSPERTYTVSGANLTSPVTVTAPAPFEISLTSGSGFGSSLLLQPTGGMVPATAIYVRYAPALANGATGNTAITHTSTGTTTQQVTVSGNALAVAPLTAGTITFGTVTETAIQVHLPTAGSGAGRIIVMNLGSPPVFIPADGPAVTGVHTDFKLATDQGAGNRIVYDGNGSGNNVVTVTGLDTGMLYYFVVYEYNSGTGTSYNYLTSPAANNNMTTHVPGLGAGNAAMANSIRIFPNPAREVLHITAPIPVQAVLTDGTGKILLRQENASRIRLEDLPQGMYLLRLTDRNGTLIRQEKVLLVH